MNCPSCVRNVTRGHPGGLCWECWVNAEDEHDRDFGERPACEPTTALPGSPAKVAVLEQRAEADRALWHKRDARIPSAMLTLLGEIWLSGLQERVHAYPAPQVSVREEVLTYLREAARPLRPRDVALALGLPCYRVSHAFRRLADAGQVSKIGHCYIALGVVSLPEPSPVLEGIAS